MIYLPVYISDFYIYDVYLNCENRLIIVSPAEDDPLEISYQGVNFEVVICPHNHTFIYKSRQSVKYSNTIEIEVSGRKVRTKVNQYPNLKNMLIMSTIVLGEDDYIRQWIKFHHRLGVDHFVIYDNSTNSNSLENVLSDYIKKNLVTLIKWPYPYRLEKSGISGQTTQQNHSIYAFNDAMYIGLFDIDEYINLQEHYNIKDYINFIIESENIEIANIAAFDCKSKPFHNPQNLPTRDFDFLKIFDCEEIVMTGQQKCFVVPRNVHCFSVHMVTLSAKSLVTYNLSPSEIYFNHYIFLNKQNEGLWYYENNEIHKNKLGRGRAKTDISDLSILRHLDNEWI